MGQLIQIISDSRHLLGQPDVAVRRPRLDGAALHQLTDKRLHLHASDVSLAFQCGIFLIRKTDRQLLLSFQHEFTFFDAGFSGDVP